MLEQLIGMATQQLSQGIEQNPDIDHSGFDYNDAAQTVGSSIFETIASQVSGGDLGALQEMISGQDTDPNNSALSGLQDNIVNSLSQKSGIDSGMAKTIASMAIPMIMNMFNKQAGQAQSNGIDLGGLVASALSGGNQQSGGGLLGGLLGKFLGGGRQQNQQQDIGSQVLGSVLGQLMK